MGVDDEFALALKELLHQPRNWSKQSIKKGCESSKDKDPCFVISIPKNLFTSPSLVSLKLSGPFCIDLTRRLINSIEGLMMIQPSM